MWRLAETKVFAPWFTLINKLSHAKKISKNGVISCIFLRKFFLCSKWISQYFKRIFFVVVFFLILNNRRISFFLLLLFFGVIFFFLCVNWSTELGACVHVLCYFNEIQALRIRIKKFFFLIIFLSFFFYYLLIQNIFYLFFNY